MKKINNKRFYLKEKKNIKYLCTDNNPTVRVSADTYNILVELANENGLSMSKVASCAIAYAYKNYDNDVEFEEE